MCVVFHIHVCARVQVDGVGVETFRSGSCSTVILITCLSFMSFVKQKLTSVISLFHCELNNLSFCSLSNRRTHIILDSSYSVFYTLNVKTTNVCFVTSSSN